LQATRERCTLPSPFYGIFVNPKISFYAHTHTHIYIYIYIYIYIFLCVTFGLGNLKMEIAVSSDTVSPIYRTTQAHVIDENNFYSHSRKSLVFRLTCRSTSAVTRLCHSTFWRFVLILEVTVNRRTNRRSLGTFQHMWCSSESRGASRRKSTCITSVFRGQLMWVVRFE
jgi:hypothetical protein